MNTCRFQCSHVFVSYTNKNLGSEWVTTFLTHKLWRVYIFLKEDGWCLEWLRDVFMSLADIWPCVSVHERQGNSLTKTLFWGHRWTTGLQFQSHRWTWRSWSFLELHRLWDRLRLGVVEQIQMLIPVLLVSFIWTVPPLIPFESDEGMEMTVPHKLNLESEYNYIWTITLLLIQRISICTVPTVVILFFWSPFQIIFFIFLFFFFSNFFW